MSSEEANDELTDDEVARWEPEAAQWYVSSYASPTEYEYPPTQAEFRRDRAMTRAVRRALRAHVRGDPIPSYPNDPEKQALVRNVVKVARHFDIDVQRYIETLDPYGDWDPTAQGLLREYEQGLALQRERGEPILPEDMEEWERLKEEADAEAEEVEEVDED